MSHRATDWAYKQDVRPAGRKFVLVALSDFADEAHSCFPSQALLAEMTGQTRQTVGDHMEALEEAGLIARQRRSTKDGYRTSDRITLAVDGPLSNVGNPDVGVEPMSGKQGVLSRDFTPPMSGTPSGTIREPLENHQRRATARRRKPETVIPEDFAPTEGHAAYARQHGLDLPGELIRFRTHAVAHDRRLRDWGAGFAMWLSKAVQLNPRPTSSGWERAERIGGGWA